MKFKKNLSNQELAEGLRSVAMALEIQGESVFRIIAYKKAASSIEDLNQDLKEIWQKKELENLPGIGKNIASHLDEYFKTGEIKHFKEVFKNIPESVFKLAKIPGLGPKLAFKLAKNLKITDKKTVLKKIKQAALSHKISQFPGFGVKTEQEILIGLAEINKMEKRLLLPEAENISNNLINYLKKSKVIIKADPLGSLRRKKATVRDIDIAISSNNPKEVINYFLKYPNKKRIVESGEHKATIIVTPDYQVDLMVEKPGSYGTLLQHFTGSKEHNIHLREIAIKNGLSLSEHGLKKGKKIIKFKSEQDLYKYLKMEYVPPEIREDRGEIEKSLQGNLPKLVQLSDIKGDLHLHSDFKIETSHDNGENSMKEIRDKAAALGYQYIAFSEHNPSISNHSKKDIINIIKRKKQIIDKLNYSFNNGKLSTKSTKVFIFNSLEIDIRPNGSLSIPEKAFNYLDFAIVSVHSSFRLNKTKMTKRVISGLSHPKIKILGHPTGRLLLKRQSYQLDWEVIFDFCLNNNKYLEINAHPKRLDLSDRLIKKAIDLGLKLFINSDSHAISDMNNMKYGVYNARRGWAKKDDILNCMSYNNIKKLLVSKS
ncbi:hypothetical protein COT75_00130 [Candidatus Beckwithbacteria bacterium CG10_big_fil_rev_8_21_14_0_10_34_10]|uniref:DNA polymerase beta n=1 Tax=Candidatus Beckwithbacteria bacterium CG10_big_fil_rev_8_21_14_0_10_34_10 TaxID=1974495 RepID=A0A2H0WCG8_9BACT|nr:MAG: hypothetical protein COT75_00130 [Candidatus Beckwithbacteria bacterium CG10_big_fil_rev_8_21_14_0_10_34_10]